MNSEDCWAKTDENGRPALTVRDHCLIVGAVASAVADLLPPAVTRLLPSGGVTLTAAHDIGKLTPGFQGKIPFSPCSKLPGLDICVSDHARVSHVFLAQLIRDQHGDPSFWALAADGHHGRYSSYEPADSFGRRGEGFQTWPQSLRQELLRELEQSFGELPSSEVFPGGALHWMTGFIIFCDWIGSNTDWFPLVSGEPLRHRVTLPEITSRAEEVVQSLLWHRREVRPNLEFADLFAARNTQARITPRPLQASLISAADAPGLYIVEAPMGLGKTEAALATAYRRWTEGTERGLYFALPTQLTSNRIHDRVQTFLQNCVADASIHALVHGSAWLREDRIHNFSPAATSTESGAADACRWFAGSRRPLLAPFATGTIDQALMARIAAKHSALRLFALAGKVVVIDEVHSYDPYTAKLVDGLVNWLIETGSTVIILSATLTAKRRRELVAAAGAEEPQPAPADYPLITKVTDGRASHIAVVETLPEKTIQINHQLEGEANWVTDAAEAARYGACVLIIRNSVRLAQETFRRFREAVCAPVEVGLLHSRFAHWQRLVHEGLWMERLGKNGTSRPRGCILVATQVVEQSVDIDADWLLTDLAPTDLLLQRIGRLHRHERSRPAGFHEPKCTILCPEVDWNQSDARGIKEALGDGGRIYPPVTLWQSWAVWQRRSAIQLPGDIRKLLEAAQEIPDTASAGVHSLWEELERLTRDQVLCGGRQDPFTAPDLEDTEGAQTRWRDQPSAMLTLLRERPAQRGREIIMTPVHGNPVIFVDGVFSYDLAKAIHTNAIRLPRYLVQHALNDQPGWLRSIATDTVIGVWNPDATSVSLPFGPESPYSLEYRPDLGVSFTKRLTATTPSGELNQPEDSWF